eukprot:Nitzschia sp. Nitz4//scaffold22_size323478//302476//305917//NITZ4_000590-RA/size323478-processed-gene-0.428-mRNA-1//1//CDS//3329543186//1156//frame0
MKVFAILSFLATVLPLTGASSILTFKQDSAYCTGNLSDAHIITAKCSNETGGCTFGSYAYFAAQVNATSDLPANATMTISPSIPRLPGYLPTHSYSGKVRNYCGSLLSPPAGNDASYTCPKAGFYNVIVDGFKIFGDSAAWYATTYGYNIGLSIRVKDDSDHSEYGYCYAEIRVQKGAFSPSTDWAIVGGAGVVMSAVAGLVYRRRRRAAISAEELEGGMEGSATSIVSLSFQTVDPLTMWSQSWTKGLSEALEKTGEAFSNAEKQATKGFTDALGKTTEAISQATNQARGQANNAAPAGSAASDETPPRNVYRPGTKPSDAGERQGTQAGDPRFPVLNANGTKVLKNLQMGWSSVVESTKRTVEATKEAVETERSRLEHNFLKGAGKAFYKRDPKLPLDVEALRDAQVVYITDRILVMSHPAMDSNVNASLTAQRKLAAVGHLLQRRHDGRYLVWNLSEVEYDTSVLDDQVLTFSFPGSPSPPLGLLLKLLISMENWMKADKRNVAVIHCLTGKGRTSTVLAAFLCWMGEAGFGDIHQALDYIAKCKQMTANELIIPSQRRYAIYFKNMLDGVRPSQPPLLLKRIIMSEAPKLARGPAQGKVQVEKGDGPADQAVPVDDESLMGCAPYLQIFKAGKLVYTTAATLHVHQDDEELPFVQVIDGTVPFNIDQVIQGDILIRCRHLTFNKQRVSMFRAAFHTGYVPPNVLRLNKAQLDGACTDKRYSDDFFIDLIFEKVDTETATKHLEEQAEMEEEGIKTSHSMETGKGPIVTASTNDEMLQGNSRFWDVIANRRQEQNAKDDSDPNWGPTVGRRRSEDKDKVKEEATKTAASKPSSALQAFSIGTDFDFFPSEPEVVPTEPAPAERDSLMEALDALDEEDIGTEEVVFEDASTQNPSVPPSEATSGDEASEAAEGTATPQAAPSSTVTSEIDVADMDALLAAANEDFGDMNLDDLDDLDDDDDLDDLEAMLKT